jgi:hypothetical protein
VQNQKQVLTKRVERKILSISSFYLFVVYLHEF